MLIHRSKQTGLLVLTVMCHMSNESGRVTLTEEIIAVPALAPDAVLPWVCKCLRWQSTGSQDMGTGQGFTRVHGAELVDREVPMVSFSWSHAQVVRVTVTIWRDSSDCCHFGFLAANLPSSPTSLFWKIFFFESSTANVNNSFVIKWPVSMVSCFVVCITYFGTHRHFL